MKELNDITYLIRGAAYKVHDNLGPGLLESIYEKIFIYELGKAGLSVKQQVSVPIIYDNKKFEGNFRLDLLINDQIIIEIKSVECLSALHSKQLLTYLRLTGKRLGLLINFNCLKMDKDNIVRLIY